MAFLILMIGVFITIATKESGVSLFKNKTRDLVHLTFFVLAIALYVVNGTLVQLVPDLIVLYLSILLVIPLFVKFLKRNGTADL
ncbi:hypothetical protein ABC345_06715 [Shouchella sp. 1P09AA]|uniref:hypothetical protein n=1 Tax=unclassified Shouchella TaxID=2893065 RepID=UPI0039A15215